ncbi:MAG: hypothetical protein QXG52_09280 [Candidatus Caldarchaeum sp.]
METRKIDVSRPSTVRRLKRLLEELEEVSNLVRDAENGRVEALAVELGKPDALVEVDVSRENTFSGLQKRLGWSSRTLAKYLRFCESNGWVYGYRDGGCVRYFITPAGLDFVYKCLVIGSLHDLARFVLSFPQARFYGWPAKPVGSDSPAGTLVVEGRQYLLYGSEDVSGLEGRVIDLFTRLLRGLGLRIFTFAELEARMGRPLTPEDIEKLNTCLEPRPRQPLAKIMPLLNWAALMNRNLHANNELYLRYVRGRPTDFAILDLRDLFKVSGPG